MHLTDLIQQVVQRRQHLTLRHVEGKDLVKVETVVTEKAPRGEERGADGGKRRERGVGTTGDSQRS